MSDVRFIRLILPTIGHWYVWGSVSLYLIILLIFPNSFLHAYTIMKAKFVGTQEPNCVLLVLVKLLSELVVCLNIDCLL